MVDLDDHIHIELGPRSAGRLWRSANYLSDISEMSSLLQIL